MILREYLPTWLGGKQRAAGNPIEFNAPFFSNFFGPGIGNQPSPETLLEENIGVADRATRAIANRISTLNPQVKISKREQAGTVVDEILDDHPLKALLDRPHPNITRAQLLRLSTQWIVTVGEAYWYKVGNGLGIPTEIHPVPPTHIFPVVEQNVISGYTVTDGKGSKRTIPPDLIVRFYFPDPENPWGSEGYLGPSGIVADTLKFAGQHIRAHYQSDATPKTALEAQENAEGFTEVQKERFWTMWRKHYHNRLGTDVGIPGIIPTGYKLVQMIAQSGADIVPLLEFLRDEQLMDFGVPRSVLGQVVSGDRSSAEVNQWVMDKYSVLPIANLIQDGITLQLAPDFDPSVFVEFEKFVSDDKRFNLEQETADLTNKVRSINQVREDRNLDPVSWGDEPVGRIGEMPYDPDLAYDLGEDEAEALGTEQAEETPEEPRAKGNGRIRLNPGKADGNDKTNRGYFAPAAEWQRQLAREKAYVPSFEKEMKAIFGIQERSVVKRLNATTPRARKTIAELFTVEEWRNLFEKRVEPVRLKAFETILGETLEGFGIEEFILTDEMRFLLRQQGALLVNHANRTTQTMIARQLEKATVEGEGIDQMAKRIKAVFRTRRRHARTIARTEILKASQEAQIVGFETSGVVGQKQWNSSMDDAVRDAHGGPGSTIANPIVGLREPFILDDGELADAPGIGLNHSQLSAANAINCRCFVTPVIGE